MQADFAELSEEELEMIQELEAVLSHIKGRQIALVVFDLGEIEDDEEAEFVDAFFDIPTLNRDVDD